MSLANKQDQIQDKDFLIQHSKLPEVFQFIKSPI